MNTTQTAQTRLPPIQPIHLMQNNLPLHTTNGNRNGDLSPNSSTTHSNQSVHNGMNGHHRTLNDINGTALYSTSNPNANPNVNPNSRNCHDMNIQMLHSTSSSMSPTHRANLENPTNPTNQSHTASKQREATADHVSSSDTDTDSDDDSDSGSGSDSSSDDLGYSASADNADNEQETKSMLRSGLRNRKRRRTRGTTKGKISGYNIFFGIRCREMQKSKPNLEFADISRNLGAEWKSLSKAQQQRWKEKAAKKEQERDEEEQTAKKEKIVKTMKNRKSKSPPKSRRKAVKPRRSFSALHFEYESFCICVH